MTYVNTNISTLSKGVTDLARDAAYVAVGLGVLGYQRVQVQRVELKNKLSQDLSLEQRLGDVRQGVAKGFHQIDDLTESATNFVESTLQPLCSTPTTLAVSPPPTRTGRRRASSRAGSWAASPWPRATSRRPPATRERRRAGPDRGPSRG
jgi:hypothetical protein